MTLFEQIKGIPKVDLHINLTSSISPDLAFDLTDSKSIPDIIDQMQQRSIIDYNECLNIPIQVLSSKNNIILAINDLIDRLIKNNVIYSELFLDLPLYTEINVDNLVKIILKEITKRNYNMNLVLCLSDKFTKEKNIEILDILDKYYGNGINGVYFKKGKMTSLISYHYIFDRLIKNNINYILSLDTKVTSNDRDIYYNAKRIIYSLNEKDESILNSIREQNILLEFSITSLIENNVVCDIKDSFIYDIYKDNYLVTFTSCDMTVLNTDIVNEYCLLFNSLPITLHDMIKIITNSVISSNINTECREKLIIELKEKINSIL